jgi:hypothetical protein
MGGSYYSHDSADFIRISRAAKPIDDIFVNNKLGKIDPAMNPLGVKLRESRDSDAHPESNAIVIIFDVTGSMGGIPALFAKDKLPGLMKMLLTQSVIPDPQIFMGAIGDAHSDQAPLQIGQFESGLEMDMWLTKIWLEGNGGGQNRESYDLALYWVAKHTSIDCWEKRSKKGYFFTIGDENYYNKTDASLVKKFIGDDLESDIPIKDVVGMANEMYEHIHICVPSDSYGDGHLPQWKELLGERAVFLNNPKHVCEFIAAQISAFEGLDHSSISTGLKTAGFDHHAADIVTKALVPSSGRTGMVKRGTVTGDLEKSKKGGSTRL